MTEKARRNPNGNAAVPLWWSLSVVAVLTGLAVVILWARNRGLDLTDEGYYLQLYAHPEAAPPEVVPTQLYLLVDFITGHANIGIAGYRALALFLLCTSGAFLGYSLHRFARTWLPDLTMPSLPTTVSFVAVGALLGYAWAPLAVSYNTIAAALIFAATGSTLLALADFDRVRMKPRSVVHAALAGSMLPVLLYVKWPAAVLLAGIFSVFVVALLGRAGFKIVAAGFAGAALAFALVTQELAGGPTRSGSLNTAHSSGSASVTQRPAELGRDQMLAETR